MSMEFKLATIGLPHIFYVNKFMQYLEGNKALHWVPIPMPMPMGFGWAWVDMDAIFLFMGGHR